jgi:hypothetical protein
MGRPRKPALHPQPVRRTAQHFNAARSPIQGLENTAPRPTPRHDTPPPMVVFGALEGARRRRRHKAASTRQGARCSGGANRGANTDDFTFQ